jgi:hypothetical protein
LSDGITLTVAKLLGHNLDFCFRNGYKLDAKFDLPVIRKQKIDLSDLRVIGQNAISFRRATAANPFL